ncbi:DUF2306 domain-containing protein [Lentzea sp. NPDC051213]|uniref:DUF2306 domain-containing protein n=1 Tax=Lentzea sp. NPDC051213 TaxID=3364126 RepID=UPI0037A233DF
MTSPVSGRVRRQIAWAAVAVSAIGIAVFAAFPYLGGDPAQSRIPLNDGVAYHYLSVVVHGMPACLVLFIGPFQFAAKLRARNPKLHRVLGRVYVVSMIFAAVAALVAATFSVSGASVQFGFYLLTAAWLYTIFQGYRSIRAGQIQLHRIWMIRNYALSFAAVALRIFLAIGLALQGVWPSLPFHEIYNASVWGSIAVCAVVAEYFIIHKTLAPLVRKRQRTAPAPEPAGVSG